MSDQPENERIGARMRKAAEARGIDAEAVATALGVKSETVYRYYQGKIAVSGDRLVQFARLVGTTLFALTPESEVENVLQSLEAIVRHQAGLSQQDTARLNEAISVLAQRVGPPPAEADDAGWQDYLARLRECLVQAHRAEIEDINTRGSQGSS